MVKSQGWDWKIVKGSHAEYWQTPSADAFYLLARWQELGLTKLLDLGCGLGRHAILFGKNGFDVSCFDISEEAIKQARAWAESENLHFSYAVGDMLHLPYPDGAFDAILSYHVINHTDTAGMRQVASELKRVLRPGGEFYLTLGSKDTWGWTDTDWPMIDENTKLRQEDGPEDNVPHFYADYDLVQDLFADFEIIDVHQLQDFHQKPGEAKPKVSWHYHVLARKR